MVRYPEILSDEFLTEATVASLRFALKEVQYTLTVESDEVGVSVPIFIQVGVSQDRPHLSPCLMLPSFLPS
jgi:hypothetical protein